MMAEQETPITPWRRSPMSGQDPANSPRYEYQSRRNLREGLASGGTTPLRAGLARSGTAPLQEGLATESKLGQAGVE